MHVIKIKNYNNLFCNVPIDIGQFEDVEFKYANGLFWKWTELGKLSNLKLCGVSVALATLHTK